MEKEKKVSNEISTQVTELMSGQLRQVTKLGLEVSTATENAFQMRDQMMDLLYDGSSGRKAVDNLQKVTENISEVQMDIIRAQQVSFEYQKKLADTTKAMLALTAQNTVANNLMLEEIEKRLLQASEEELNELERAELEKVLMSLKERQSTEKKYQEMRQQLNAQEEEIRWMKDMLLRQEKEIQALKQSINGQTQE